MRQPDKQSLAYTFLPCSRETQCCGLHQRSHCAGNTAPHIRGGSPCRACTRRALAGRESSASTCSAVGIGSIHMRIPCRHVRMWPSQVWARIAVSTSERADARVPVAAHVQLAQHASAAAVGQRSPGAQAVQATAPVARPVSRPLGPGGMNEWREKE